MEKNIGNKFAILISITVAIIVVMLLLNITLPLGRYYSAAHNKRLFRKAYLTTQMAMKELSKENKVFDKVPVGEDAKKASAFCKAFAKKVGALEPVDCNSEFAFKTKDGIYWSVPKFFPIYSINPIVVDVSGGVKKNKDVSTNCTYNPVTCKSPDRLTMWVITTGKVSVFGEAEKAYLGLNPCIGQQKFKNGICENPRCKKITEYLVNGTCVKSVCPKGLVFHMRACYTPEKEPPYKFSERVRLFFE